MPVFTEWLFSQVRCTFSSPWFPPPHPESPQGRREPAKPTVEELDGPPRLPTDPDKQLLVGLIFAESSAAQWGGGESEFEKEAIGLVIVNRTYYATQTNDKGKSYNQDFGDGTVLSAISSAGQFLSYGRRQWKLVMHGDKLRTADELWKRLKAPGDREHFRLSVEAAEAIDLTDKPRASQLLDNQIPVAFNKAANAPPSNRMKKIGKSGSHTFYGFKEGRELE
jgi:hypothetical protein